MKLTFKKTPAEIERERQAEALREIVEDESKLDVLRQKDDSAKPEYVPMPLEGEQRVEPAIPESTPTSLQAEREVERSIEEGQPSFESLQELMHQRMPGMFSETANRFVKDEETLSQGLEDELDTQAGRASRITSETLATDDPDIMKESVRGKQSRDVYKNVLSKGTNILGTLNQRMQPMLTGTDPTAVKLQQFVLSSNLIDPTTKKLSDKVGTALAITLLETAEDIHNKTDESLPISDLRSEGSSDGMIDPDTVRERMATSLMDKLLPNPFERGDPRVRMGYGGAGTTLDPEMKSVLDTLLYDTLTSPEQNLFMKIDLNAKDPTTDLEDNRIVLTDEGQAFFNSNRPILEDLHPDRRVNVSKVPPVVQQVPGRERELGDKAKSISKRNKSSRNTAFEDAVKLRLGSIPMRIDNDRAMYAKMMVDSVVSVTTTVNGQETIELNDKHPSFFYSDNKWAKTLGLNEAKWMEAYANAKQRFTRDDQETEAVDQANKVMRMQARKLLRAMNDVAENINGVYYNKYMHASSVGRYFVRNTVLNYQTDKLVRMMVGSAKKTLVKPNATDPKSKELMEDWTYIIGKNLLDADLEADYTPFKDANGDVMRTEDMGWNPILNRTKEIMANPNGRIYNMWLNQGRALRTAVKNGDVNLFNQATDSKRLFANNLKKKDDWGYKLQSFIDFANWHDAKTGDGSFEMKAQVQHDGKQNGIAIQAMQTGDSGNLKRVGVMYDDESNIIAQGDLRQKFFDTAVAQMDVPFANSPEKEQFWSSFMSKINDMPADKKSEVIKALSKTPMMETSYGMPAQYHMETAMEFLESDDGKSILSKTMGEHADLEYKNRDLVVDLNKVIGQGLRVLDLQQQQLYKTAGKIWAMLGVVPELIGPLGTDIYMGTNEHFKTGQSIPVQTPSGVVNLELTESRATGSAGKRVRIRVYDPETGEYKLTDRSRYGQLVANQLPVLTVQQIDAAVMANTIMAVNDAKRLATQGASFVMPVHDAIITDATSVKRYHREINNQFKKVNMNYSISKAIENGLSAALTAAKEKAKRNPGRRVAVDYDSEYRALHDHLVGLQQGLDELTQEAVTTKGNVIKPRVQLPKKSQALLTKAIQNGWKPEGGEMPFSAVVEIIEDIAAGKQVIANLRTRHKDMEAQKSRIWKLISEMIYQYN